MSMIEEEYHQLQMEDKTRRVKEARRKYILSISLVVCTALTISASATKDRSTFLLLFSARLESMRRLARCKLYHLSEA